tara:strand:+ start:1097 stop:2623 length:1527 start_codon:yes stop_codon:yes gene_type:complete
MKIIFGAQGGFLKIYYDVYNHINKNNSIIKHASFLTADSDYYFANRFEKVLPNRSDIDLIKEWELTSKKDIHLEEKRYTYLKRKYKDFNLWEAIACDRRLMYGGNAKFIQNYNIRYTNEQLINIIYHTLDKIDSLLECDEEMCVITPIPACYYDYLLYFAATVNNKQYLQLKFTKVDNRIIYSHSFSGECPEEINSSYNKYLKQPIPNNLEKNSTDYITRAKEKKQIYEGVIVDNKSFSDFFIQLKRDLLGGVIKKYLLPNLFTRFKDPHVPPFYSDFISKYFIKPFRKIRIKSITRKRMINIDDLQKSQIYFYPMHSEPEIAISVHGKEWQNQIELIRKISQSIPLGSKLIIKEHPKSIGYRSLSYYNSLLQIPNLFFIDAQTSTKEVIINSQLVFVLSGFVGFEAIILEKPVIAFGDIMYSCLPNSMIKKCTDTSRLSELVKSMEENYEYSQDSFKSYIAAVYENTEGINFYSSLLGKKGRHSVGSDNSYEKHIKLLSNFIYSKLR